jgi:hypothetical protein
MKFMAASGVLLAAAAFAAGANTLVGIDGNARNPFASAARARVFLFVRTDCPITNRYAPELQRLFQEFGGARPNFGWSIPIRRRRRKELSSTWPNTLFPEPCCAIPVICW